MSINKYRNQIGDWKIRELRLAADISFRRQRMATKFDGTQNVISSLSCGGEVQALSKYFDNLRKKTCQSTLITNRVYYKTVHQRLKCNKNLSNCKG